MSSFSLASYQPVAFHAYPELMRARRAAPPEPADTVPRSPAPEPVVTGLSATVLGIGATGLLRSGLSGFLDGAGQRRDVRVSVGVICAADVEWVLSEAVPFDVRALPHYPADGAAYGTCLPVAPPDAEPNGHRLVVVLWGIEPRPLTWAGADRPDLVVHCLDGVVEPAQLRMLAGPGKQVVLFRTVPAARPDLLAHCGRLLTGWAAFQEVPRGLALTSLDGERP